MNSRFWAIVEVSEKPLRILFMFALGFVSLALWVRVEHLQGKIEQEQIRFDNECRLQVNRVREQCDKAMVAYMKAEEAFADATRAVLRKLGEGTD